MSDVPDDLGAPESQHAFPDNIRRRPDMYVGDTREPAAFAYVVCGLFLRPEDHHLAGRGSRLDVHVAQDGTVVIAFDAALYGTDPDLEGRTELERWFCEGEGDPWFPYPRGTRPTEREACALSETLEVTVHDGTLAHSIRFARGVMVEAVHCIGTSSRLETTLTLRPDLTILTHEHGALKDYVRHQIEDLSARCPRLIVTLDAPSERTVFRSPNGIADLLVRRSIDAPPLAPLLHAMGKVEACTVEVALRWYAGEVPARMRVQAFARRVGPYPNGGAPVTGVRRAVRRWLAPYGVAADDCEAGLLAMVLAERPNPRLSTNYISVYGDGVIAAVERVTDLALAQLGTPPDALLAWLRREGR